MLEIAQGRSKLSLDLPDSDANHNAAVSHNHPSNYNNRKTGKTRPLLHINWKVAMIKLHQRQLLLFMLCHGVLLLFVSCCVETIANIYNTFDTGDGVVTLWAFNFGAERGQHDYIYIRQSSSEEECRDSDRWAKDAESWRWAFEQSRGRRCRRLAWMENIAANGT